MEENQKPDLAQIKFQCGPKLISVQEYLEAVPSKYRHAATLAAYEVLRRGYPLNRCEIERLAREGCNMQKPTAL